MLDITSNKVIHTLKTVGYNPLFWTEEELEKAFQQDFHAFEKVIALDKIEKVYFYGAGCSADDRISRVDNALTTYLPSATTSIETDLLGAARGLLGQKEGIAAILGTGANSCLYKQGKVIDKPVSLGYMLSDFGSGATLGLAFLQKLLTTQLSMETISHFIDTYNLTTNDILEALYKKKSPNTFCASFAPFIIEHHQHDELLKKMILDQFKEFIQYYIIPFNRTDNEVRITGSIAHHFSSLLNQAFEDAGLPLPEVIKSPTEGLINYHLNISLK